MSTFFADTDLHLNQQTIADTVVCMGTGLHSGLKVMLSIVPAEAYTGIEFVRRDVTHCNNVIPARWDKVTDTELSTTVSNSMGIRVSTIEHLMAALSASGIDNAIVVVDSPEIPIMDGSSKPFIDLINTVGIRDLGVERNVIVIDQPVGVTQNRASSCYLPSVVPWLDMTIEFPHSIIGKQHLSCPFSMSDFRDNVAGARTFGFQEHLAEMKRRGLARGSSLQNAVLVADNKVVNDEGLRYKDEFVRHKFLDAVGDLALAGHYVIGQFKGHRSGHKLNNLLLRELFSTKSWRLVPISEAQKSWEAFVIEQDELASISA